MNAEATPALQKGHPKGLTVLFTTEMWERFNFYGMRAILILYMTEVLSKGGLGWGKSFSSIVYGCYTAMAYILPIIGGYLADNYLGRRRALTIGGLLMMAGQFTLALNPNSPAIFILGLAIISIGCGFFKPNISTMVGDLYTEGDARRDSAYTIFYMGINLGGFLGTEVCSFFADTPGFGYHWGFGAAGVGMALGLLTFWLTAPKYLGTMGIVPAGRAAREAKRNNEPTVLLTKNEVDQIWVLGVIIVFVTFFWMGFEQAGSSMNLYARDFINRSVGKFEVPTGALQGVNQVFIILLSLPFAALWVWLAKRGQEPNTPVKMALGMIALGVGFLFMVGAVVERGGDNPDMAIKANMLWIVMAYLFHTIGELCLSPVGLSLFSKLSPAKFASMLMGLWFTANGLALLGGGILASFIDTLGASRIFGGIATVVILLGLVLLALSGKLKKMMHGKG